MVRMAVLSAWAELQVASKEQAYLVQVMEPQVAILTPLWLSSLHEFARLRFEPDISSTLGMNPDDGLDTVYAALNRQTLLKVSCAVLPKDFFAHLDCSFIKTRGSNLLMQSPVLSIKIVILCLTLSTERMEKPMGAPPRATASIIAMSLLLSFLSYSD